MIDEGIDASKRLLEKVKSFTQKIFSPNQLAEEKYKELHIINNEIKQNPKKELDLTQVYSDEILISFRCLLISDYLAFNDGRVQLTKVNESMRGPLNKKSMWNTIKKEVITFFMELIRLKTSVIKILKGLWIHLILTISLDSQTKKLKGENFEQDLVLKQIDFFLLWTNLQPDTFPLITANFLNSLLQKIITNREKTQPFGIGGYSGILSIIL